MKVLVSGSTGLVGSCLVQVLKDKGCEVLRLLRPTSDDVEEETVTWDPLEKSIELDRLEGLDAVIHLGGAGIADRRWTESRKKLLRSSRVDSTKFLAQTLSKLKKPPKTFICASGVGYYGNRGPTKVTESGKKGTGFLSQLAAEWEKATADANKASIRTISLRIGVVLAKEGGALSRMLLPFKLGLGGKIGSGGQYMSWITLEDLCEVIHFCLIHKKIEGPVNTITPHAVTNYDFTKALGKALSRPTIFPMPAFIAKLVFGEMGEELLLSGQNAAPKKLVDAGFSFIHPKIDGALASLLK